MLFGVNPPDRDNPFWFTVGGGADPGETLAEAAARELFEEVGIAADPAALGQPVWSRTTKFSFDGTRYQQEEEYFLLRVSSTEVSFDGMDADERDTVIEHRWLTAADLESLTVPFFPPGLPVLLRGLL